MSRRSLLILVLIAGLALVLLFSIEKKAEKPEAVTLPLASPTAGPPGMPQPTPRQMEQATGSPEPVLHEFKNRFGKDLQARFRSDGKLESIRGSMTAGGTPASADFRPDDPVKAKERAREIVEAARDLVGFPSGSSLGEPVAHGSEVSAQVYFRQQIGGIPLLPHGSITVDLGPHGELIGLYADSVSAVKVMNQARLDEGQARARAIAAIPDQRAGMKVEGGSRVIWVSQVSGIHEGRHAYEFNVQGHQVIIDAESGAVLYRRDRRIY